MKDVIVSVARTRLANIAAAVFAESARLAGLARLPRLARVAEVAGAGLDREGGRRRRRVRVAGAAAGDGGRGGVGVERVGGARDARGLVRQLVVEAPDAGLAEERASLVPREVEWKSILPPSEYLLYLGWETRYGFHDLTPFESAIYEFGDKTIQINAPPKLTTIHDTPAFYFLTQVKDETIRLNAEVKSSKFLQPSGIAEIDFHFSLLSAKILDYASNYGCSTSPSWTLAKDVPEDIIKAMLSYGHNTPLFVHMAQIHIFYMAYIEAHIETFSPDIDVTTFRNAEFQFLGLAPPAQGTSKALRDSRKTINWGRITAYKDDLVLSYLVDYEATENWERDYNAPHDDDGPPSKRCRTGDYEPGDNEPERYSPTSPEYCP